MKKILMVCYSVLFLFAIISFNKDNISLGYNPMYVLWSIFIDVTGCIGNFLYTFGVQNANLKKFWKIYTPIFIIDFFVAAFVDVRFSGDMADVNPIALLIVFWLGFLFYLPAFRANYRLGYSKIKIVSASNT